jgi:hypothetical protein
MLFISLALFSVAVILAFSVVESERTGRLPYSRKLDLPSKEIVNRAEQPAKFDQVIGVASFRALVFGGIGAVAFYFYRRLGE